MSEGEMDMEISDDDDDDDEAVVSEKLAYNKKNMVISFIYILLTKICIEI